MHRNVTCQPSDRQRMRQVLSGALASVAARFVPGTDAHRPEHFGLDVQADAVGRLRRRTVHPWSNHHVAVDRIGSIRSLADIFGEETVLVNIAKETGSGTIAQRVRAWLAQNERNVYIGRGSLFGNPYSHEGYGEFQVATREEAIAKYREYLLSRPELMDRLKELKGKRLGCWCKPDSCHGDVIMELLWEVGGTDNDG